MTISVNITFEMEICKLERDCKPLKANSQKDYVRKHYAQFPLDVCLKKINLHEKRHFSRLFNRKILRFCMPLYTYIVCSIRIGCSNKNRNKK